MRIGRGMSRRPAGAVRGRDQVSRGMEGEADGADRADMADGAHGEEPEVAAQAQRRQGMCLS